MYKLIPLSVLLCLPLVSMAHNATAAATDITVYVHQDATIYSSHEVILTNNSDVPASLTYFYQLCADHVKHCSTYEKTVIVKPWSIERHHKKLSLHHTYNHYGTYHSTAYTEVRGAIGHTATGTITVRNNDF